MKRNGRENGRNEREDKVDEKEWELEKMTVDGQKREIGERKGGIIRKTGEGWKKAVFCTSYVPPYWRIKPMMLRGAKSQHQQLLGDAVASAGPRANDLHLAADR